MNDGNCLIPSQIKIKTKQLVINVFRGENLPDEDDPTKILNDRTDLVKLHLNNNQYF